MRKIAITLTFLIIVFLNAVHASDPTPSSTKAPANKDAPVAKKIWVENMQNKLPLILCEKDQYFMKCFSVTENECIDFNKLFVQACLNNVTLALPAELKTQEGKHWGAVVGKCTLDLFEKFVASKKQPHAECNQEKENETKEEIQKPSKKEQPKP